MEKPRRRYEVEMHIGADDLASFKRALNGILFDLERRKEDDPIDMVSGGWDVGYSMKVVIDPTITHDSWYESLKAYLERAAHANGESEVNDDNR